MYKRDFLRIDQQMEQHRAACELDGGATVAVTLVELLALANLARFGVYIALGAAEDQDPETADKCNTRAAQLMEAMMAMYPEQGTLPKLVRTAAAIMGGEKIGKFVIPH